MGKKLSGSRTGCLGFMANGWSMALYPSVGALHLHNGQSKFLPTIVWLSLFSVLFEQMFCTEVEYRTVLLLDKNKLPVYCKFSELSPLYK